MRGLGSIAGFLLLLFVPRVDTSAQAFELNVVSVRPGKVEAGQTIFAPGRMELVNWTLADLVGFAFAPPARLIEGWPDSGLRDQRFVVSATYSGESTPPLTVRQRFVRQILEERFELRAHTARREQPVYTLRLLKPGVVGPGVVKVDYNCADPETRAKRAPADCPRGGDRTEDRGIFWRASGSIDVLLSRLRPVLKDRPLIDQTGLDGFYRFELLLVEKGEVVRLPLPSLPELLPTQLGMTIQSTRQVVDILIVDNISMPTPN